MSKAKSIFEKNAVKIKVLLHPLSCKIFQFLKQNEGCNVKHIYRTLKLEQSVVSSALSKLRKHKFVIGRSSGREIHYSNNNPVIKEYLNEMIDDL